MDAIASSVVVLGWRSPPFAHEWQVYNEQRSLADIFMTLAPILAKPYIEQRDTGYWIAGTRISLDSVVLSYLNGESPENIAQDFPLLLLEQIYGAIAFYLSNRDIVDAYLEKSEDEFQQLQQVCREKSPLLYQKLKAAQAQKQR
jgi:uncharacterized protein (DUF433 family)